MGNRFIRLKRIVAGVLALAVAMTIVPVMPAEKAEASSGDSRNASTVISSGGGGGGDDLTSVAVMPFFIISCGEESQLAAFSDRLPNDYEADIAMTEQYKDNASTVDQIKEYGSGRRAGFVGALRPSNLKYKKGEVGSTLSGAKTAAKDTNVFAEYNGEAQAGYYVSVLTQVQSSRAEHMYEIPTMSYKSSLYFITQMSTVISTVTKPNGWLQDAEFGYVQGVNNDSDNMVRRMKLKGGDSLRNNVVYASRNLGDAKNENSTVVNAFFDNFYHNKKVTENDIKDINKLSYEALKSTGSVKALDGKYQGVYIDDLIQAGILKYVKRTREEKDENGNTVTKVLSEGYTFNENFNVDEFIANHVENNRSDAEKSLALWAYFTTMWRDVGYEWSGSKKVLAYGSAIGERIDFYIMNGMLALSGSENLKAIKEETVIKPDGEEKTTTSDSCKNISEAMGNLNEESRKALINAIKNCDFAGFKSVTNDGGTADVDNAVGKTSQYFVNPMYGVKGVDGGICARLERDIYNMAQLGAKDERDDALKALMASSNIEGSYKNLLEAVKKGASAEAAKTSYYNDNGRGGSENPYVNFFNAESENIAMYDLYYLDLLLQLYAIAKNNHPVGTAEAESASTWKSRCTGFLKCLVGQDETNAKSNKLNNLYIQGDPSKYTISVSMGLFSSGDDISDTKRTHHVISTAQDFVNAEHNLMSAKDTISARIEDEAAGYLSVTKEYCGYALTDKMDAASMAGWNELVHEKNIDTVYQTQIKVLEDVISHGGINAALATYIKGLMETLVPEEYKNGVGQIELLNVLKIKDPLVKDALVTSRTKSGTSFNRNKINYKDNEVIKDINSFYNTADIVDVADRYKLYTNRLLDAAQGTLKSDNYKFTSRLTSGQTTWYGYIAGRYAFPIYLMKGSDGNVAVDIGGKPSTVAEAYNINKDQVDKGALYMLGQYSTNRGGFYKRATSEYRENAFDPEKDYGQIGAIYISALQPYPLATPTGGDTPNSVSSDGKKEWTDSYEYLHVKLYATLDITSSMLEASTSSEYKKSGTEIILDDPDEEDGYRIETGWDTLTEEGYNGKGYVNLVKNGKIRLLNNSGALVENDVFNTGRNNKGFTLLNDDKLNWFWNKQLDRIDSEPGKINKKAKEGKGLDRISFFSSYKYASGAYALDGKKAFAGTADYSIPLSYTWRALTQTNTATEHKEGNSYANLQIAEKTTDTTKWKMKDVTFTSNDKIALALRIADYNLDVNDKIVAEKKTTQLYKQDYDSAHDTFSDPVRDTEGEGKIKNNGKMAVKAVGDTKASAISEWLKEATDLSEGRKKNSDVLLTVRLYEVDAENNNAVKPVGTGNTGKFTTKIGKETYTTDSEGYLLKDFTLKGKGSGEGSLKWFMQCVGNGDPLFIATESTKLVDVKCRTNDKPYCAYTAVVTLTKTQMVKETDSNGRHINAAGNLIDKESSYDIEWSTIISETGKESDLGANARQRNEEIETVAENNKTANTYKFKEVQQTISTNVNDESDSLPTEYFKEGKKYFNAHTASDERKQVKTHALDTAKMLETNSDGTPKINPSKWDSTNSLIVKADVDNRCNVIGFKYTYEDQKPEPTITTTITPTPEPEGEVEVYIHFQEAVKVNDSYSWRRTGSKRKYVTLVEYYADSPYEVLDDDKRAPEGVTEDSTEADSYRYTFNLAKAVKKGKLGRFKYVKDEGRYYLLDEDGAMTSYYILTALSPQISYKGKVEGKKATDWVGDSVGSDGNPIDGGRSNSISLDGSYKLKASHMIPRECFTDPDVTKANRKGRIDIYVPLYKEDPPEDPEDPKWNVHVYYLVEDDMLFRAERTDIPITEGFDYIPEESIEYLGKDYDYAGGVDSYAEHMPKGGTDYSKYGLSVYLTTRGHHVDSPGEAQGDVNIYIPYTRPVEGYEYHSVPEAYAEMKNADKAETPNANDDSRADKNYQELFEAMAGVPSTELLYFAVGGSEFIVEFRTELEKEVVERTYCSHYNGVACEFKETDALHGASGIEGTKEVKLDKWAQVFKDGNLVTKESTNAVNGSVKAVTHTTINNKLSEWYNMPKAKYTATNTFTSVPAHGNSKKFEISWEGTISNADGGAKPSDHKDSVGWDGGPSDNAYNDRCREASDSNALAGEYGEPGAMGSERNADFHWNVEDYNKKLKEATDWAKAMEEVSDTDKGQIAKLANSDGVIRSWHSGTATITIKFENISRAGENGSKEVQNVQPDGTLNSGSGNGKIVTDSSGYDANKLENANDARLGTTWREKYGSKAKRGASSGCYGSCYDLEQYRAQAEQEKEYIKTWECPELPHTGHTHGTPKEVKEKFKYRDPLSSAITGGKVCGKDPYKITPSEFTSGDAPKYIDCTKEVHNHSGWGPGSCYSNLSCDKEEHSHSPSCYDEEGQNTCGKDPHTHGRSCYDTAKGSETCGKKVHNHRSDDEEPCNDKWETPKTASHTVHECTHTCGSWKALVETEAIKMGDVKFTITVTFEAPYTMSDGLQSGAITSKDVNVCAKNTLPAHVLCGPCCRHDLPAISDSYTQRAEIWTARITDLNVLMLNEGYVEGMTEIRTGGDGTDVEKDVLEALILQGQPNIFYNIAASMNGMIKTTSSSGTSGSGSYPGLVVKDGSVSGRLRYSLQTAQDDNVFWEEYDVNPSASGAHELHRSNWCDGSASTLSGNPAPDGGRGHEEAWATGILYTHTGFKHYDYPNNMIESSGRLTSTKTGYNSYYTDNLDRLTREYKRFYDRRHLNVDLTVISDFLILQTSSGDEPVMYYERTVSAPAQNDFPEVTWGSTTEAWSEMTERNPYCKKSTTLIRGGYNGRYDRMATKYEGSGGGARMKTAFDNDYLEYGSLANVDELKDSRGNLAQISTNTMKQNGLFYITGTNTQIGQTDPRDGEAGNPGPSLATGAKQNNITSGVVSDGVSSTRTWGGGSVTRNYYYGNMDADHKSGATYDNIKLERCSGDTTYGKYTEGASENASIYHASSPCFGQLRLNRPISHLRITEIFTQYIENQNKEYTPGQAHAVWHPIVDVSYARDKSAASAQFKKDYPAEDITVEDPITGTVMLSIYGWQKDAIYAAGKTNVNSIVVQDPISADVAFVVAQPAELDQRVNPGSRVSEINENLGNLAVCPGDSAQCEHRVLNCSYYQTAGAAGEANLCESCGGACLWEENRTCSTCGNTGMGKCVICHGSGNYGGGDCPGCEGTGRSFHTMDCFTGTATHSAVPTDYYNGLLEDASTKTISIPGLKVKDVDGKTWARVFYQDVSGNTNYVNATSFNGYYNASNPGLFSCMGRLDEIKYGSGYEFILDYPDSYGSYAGAYHQWKQDENPLEIGPDSGNIKGYTCYHNDFVVSSYKPGLEKSAGSAILDGSCGHSNWWMAVGITSQWSANAGRYTMPGPSSNAYGSQSVSQCELWIRVNPASYDGVIIVQDEIDFDGYDNDKTQVVTSTKNTHTRKDTCFTGGSTGFTIAYNNAVKGSFTDLQEMLGEDLWNKVYSRYGLGGGHTHDESCYEYVSQITTYSKNDGGYKSENNNNYYSFDGAPQRLYAGEKEYSFKNDASVPKGAVTILITMGCQTCTNDLTGFMIKTSSGYETLNQAVASGHIKALSVTAVEDYQYSESVTIKGYRGLDDFKAGGKAYGTNWGNLTVSFISTVPIQGFKLTCDRDTRPGDGIFVRGNNTSKKILRCTQGEHYVAGTYTCSTCNGTGVGNNDSAPIASGDTFEFGYTGSVQQITLPAGTYRLEAWGGQGGMYESGYAGGEGGYTDSTVSLTEETTLYVYVGGKGSNYPSGTSTFNGGGAGKDGGGAGGGATDFRLVKGTCSDYSSLMSRILVAGGGGGSDRNGKGGAGGGLTGSSDSSRSFTGWYAGGGSQTAGGRSDGSAGTFGVGGGHGWNKTTMLGRSTEQEPDGYYSGSEEYPNYAYWYCESSGIGDKGYSLICGGGKHSGVKYKDVLTIGKTYELSFLARSDGGNSKMMSSCMAEPLKLTSNYEKYTIRFTADSTDLIMGSQGPSVSSTVRIKDAELIDLSDPAVIDGAGGGGGWYGGGSGWGGECGGGGGSSYVKGYKGCNTAYLSSQGNMVFYNSHIYQGGNTGNGRARITVLSMAGYETLCPECGGTGCRTYTAGINKSDLVSFIKTNINSVPLRLGEENIVNPIWDCALHGDTCMSHVCTSSCGTKYTLVCGEAHHSGKHGDFSSSCYEACHDDEKHKQSAISATMGGRAVTLGDFIVLDNYFDVYFGNTGSFYETDLRGLSDTIVQKGPGYTTPMDTTKWTREKLVRFPFPVLYERFPGEWEEYRANDWVELEVRDDAGNGITDYHFYIPLYANEMSQGQIEFAVEAINTPWRVMESNGSYWDNWQDYSFRNPGRYWTDKAYVRDNEYSNKQLDDCPLTGGITNNAQRKLDLTAYHTVWKTNVIDVIGRIGNILIEDTDDMRYSNLFKRRTGDNDWLVEGLIYNVDPASPYGYMSWHYNSGGLATDIRGLQITEESGSAYIDMLKSGTGESSQAYKDEYNAQHRISKTYDYYNTYGRLGWSEESEGAYDAAMPIASSNNRDAALNAFDALKDNELKLGYGFLWDIQTIGNYHNGILDVKPYIYALNAKTGELVPADIYIGSESEGYGAVNIFGLEDMDHSSADYASLKSRLSEWYMYFEFNKSQRRRNISMKEIQSTAAAAECCRTYVLDENGQYIIADVVMPEKSLEKSVDALGNEIWIITERSDAGTVVQMPLMTEALVPAGDYYNTGTMQHFVLDGRARTFMGGSSVYAAVIDKEIRDMDLTDFDDKRFDSPNGYTDGLNLVENDDANTNLLGTEECLYEVHGQRWHLNSKLPSSTAVVLYRGQHNLPLQTITVAGKEINAMDEISQGDDEWLLIVTADITCDGEVYSLHYSQGENNGIITSEGTTYTFRDGAASSAIQKGSLQGNKFTVPTLLAVYRANETNEVDYQIMQTH